MGSGLYPQLREILLRFGCEFVREGKGSHEIWFSSLSSKNFSVPYTIKSRHTANSILKQAGIAEKI
ncbi:type II toxin-antitoxin system HicA family toxin [Serratia fonticola]